MPWSAPVHQSVPKQDSVHDDRRGHARDDQFYSTPRWRRLRGWFLRRNPLCADPSGVHARTGRTEVATEVHHRLGRRAAPGKALDQRHLEALCKGCHSRITRHEQGQGRHEGEKGGGHG